MKVKESEAITFSVHRLCKQQDTSSAFLIALMLPSRMSSTLLKEAIILEALVGKIFKEYLKNFLFILSSFEDLNKPTDTILP